MKRASIALASFKRATARLVEEGDTMKAILREVAEAFHNTGTKLGCYTAESFDACDTSICVKAKKVLADA